MHHRPAWLVLGLLLAACTPTRPAAPDADAPDADAPARAYFEGTPRVQASIERLVAQIPEARGAERLRIGESLLAHGEPALPALLALLERDDADLRAFGAYLLGRKKDPRTYDALDAVLADESSTVRYEAATALARAGDERGMPVLIDGLVHTDPRVRSRSITVLEQATGEDFGFRADDHPHERRAAVARWTTWLDARRAARGE